MGARLGGRSPAQRRTLWWQSWWGLTITVLALVPYLMAGSLVAAMLTRPELNALEELRFLVGNINPSMLVASLIKSVVFATQILWISLIQGSRGWEQGRSSSTALSRAISLSIATVLSLDLAWVLALEPSVGSGAF